MVIKTRVFHFKNAITDEEVVKLRGAVGVTNRKEYTYPVVQYKSIEGKAAIVCVGEGEKQDCIMRFVEKCPQEIRLGKRVVYLELEPKEEWETDVQILEIDKEYHVRQWLPLNQENLIRYNATKEEDKEHFLQERILKGNLHTLAKQFGIDHEDAGKIYCKILKIKRLKSKPIKQQHFLCFDCVFRTNLVIPDFIGIGQKPSYGFGTVTKDEGALVDAYKPKKLFLLGGHDLEMLTIKKIVKAQPGAYVFDRYLEWDNAVLSAYKDVFETFSDVGIYAVELREDIVLDDKWKGRYHLIDHHNAYSHLPSSLEQVAAILGVDLSRKDKLIAANDMGSIPAMKALMATDEEIADILRQDRAAQRFYDEDEKIAEQSQHGENLIDNEINTQ